MNWPWNVRVTGMHEGRDGDQRLILPWDYYTVEVRMGGRWLGAGTAPTWWAAFFQGLAA